MTIQEQITNLEESCALITHTQTTLADWYGVAGNKLMHARSYLEQTQLKPLVYAILADPEAEHAD